MLEAGGRNVLSQGRSFCVPTRHRTRELRHEVDGFYASSADSFLSPNHSPVHILAPLSLIYLHCLTKPKLVLNLRFSLFCF